MSVLQMTFALFCMIIGIVFYGYIIASVAAGLANADAQRARYQERLDAIKSFLQVSNTRPINWTSLNRSEKWHYCNFFHTFTAAWSEKRCKRTKYNKLHGWISSVNRALDCRAGGRGFRRGPGPGLNTLDCKTVRIFAYSGKRDQSNKRSGTRLKRFTDFFTDFEKKTDRFAVYQHSGS